MNPEVKQNAARELSNNPNSKIPEDRIGEVRDFGEMKMYLPDDLKERDLNLLDEYFKATRLIKEGKKVKAKRKFRGLEKRKLSKDCSFQDFEDENRELLSTIQKAVLGKSSQDRTLPLQQKTIKYK